MKNKIIILLVITAVSIYAQDNKYRPNLKEPIQLSEETQFNILVKRIMNDYGKSFKYYDELQNRLFKFEVKNKIGYFLTIINPKKEIIESIRLYKEKINNVYFLNYKKDEINKYINHNIKKSSVNNVHLKTERIENIIPRQNILWDQIIIKIPEYHDFRVFNRILRWNI
jgi:hypothetical protein